jgi:hypothetical protein
LEGQRMNTELMDVRQVFESFMATKSKQVAELWNGKRYTNPNIQTKWHYFQLGWSLRGIK